jgi:hypothetical protein
MGSFIPSFIYSSIAWKFVGEERAGLVSAWQIVMGDWVIGWSSERKIVREEHFQMGGEGHEAGAIMLFWVMFGQYTMASYVDWKG